jgi:uncharacterized protein
MSTDVRAPVQADSTPGAPRLAGPIGLPVLRVALVGFVAFLTWLALAAAGQSGPFPPILLFAAAVMLPVNLVSSHRRS